MALITGIILVPSVVWIGNKVAVNNQLHHQQFLNGWEVSTDQSVTPCTRDGSCVHTYECDPEQHWVTDYDSKGNPDGGHWETEWHHCPYTNQEISYAITTTLGRFNVASHWLPTNPEAHRWRWSHGVPGGIPSGIPTVWAQARQRIAAGDPGPVTKQNTYDDYLLASQNTILHAFSSAKDRYLKAGLLPRVADKIQDPYFADKVYPVGVRLSGDWDDAAARFNAALGTELRGDLHLVVVNSARVTNPDEYLGALRAYWQSPALGKHQAAKNTIIVVLGTDGSTVQWARAASGMPVGNEALFADISSRLKGAPLNPEALLGHPSARIRNGQATVAHTHGLLESVVWGPHRFQRVCMKCEDKGEHGGFKYLRSEIKPTGGQKFVILLVAALLCLIPWAAAFFLSDDVVDDLLAPLRRRSA